eukprot:7217000-Pyramimonas_sp.AAC.1
MALQSALRARGRLGEAHWWAPPNCFTSTAMPLHRSCSALGVQRSSTDVAARVLVGAEAGCNLQPDARASAKAIVDIAKCFDK